MRGFDAAQARYDSMLPPEPEVFRCVSGEMNEDCEQHDYGQDCEPQEPDEPDYERDYDPYD